MSEPEQDRPVPLHGDSVLRSFADLWSGQVELTVGHHDTAVVLAQLAAFMRFTGIRYFSARDLETLSSAVASAGRSSDVSAGPDVS